MKSILKASGLFFLSIIVFNVSAQSAKPTDQGWPISKGVNYYSNKELSSFKPIKIRMRSTPLSVQAKAVHANRTESIKGNIRSTGSPDWINSKPVNNTSK